MQKLKIRYLFTMYVLLSYFGLRLGTFVDSLFFLQAGSLVRETAYNLSLVYNTVGAPLEAKYVLKKWLTI